MSTQRDERMELEELDEIIAERNQLQRELSEAREIQFGLLPKLLPRCPHHAGFELSALLEPARCLGGDLYDFFWVDEHRFFFMIGDVSEKGMPAALLMTVTKTLVKSHMLPGVSLCDMITRVNELLAEQNELLMFVTLFCGLLDVRTGELEYCDGGHNAPCLLPFGSPATTMNKKTGLALGFSPEFEFQSEKIQLQPGDGLFLFTDGITEAMNQSRDLYTEARLQSTLDALSKVTLSELLAGVMQDVQRFAAGAPQSDDIAMLVIRYRGCSGTPHTA